MLIPPNRLEQYWSVLLITAAMLLLFSVVVGLVCGPVEVGFKGLIAWLGGGADAQSAVILQSLRLPRVLLAALVGAVLAVAGCATQGLFRNPLADPSLIGVSAGASAGASVAIVILQPVAAGFAGLSVVSLCAFAGAVLVVLFVYRVATSIAGTSVATMLLAGIAFTYLAGSLSSLLDVIADNHMLRQMSLWRMGALDAANFTRVMIMATVAVPVLGGLFSLRQPLNALLLGESEARHLGVNVDRVKQGIIVCVAAGVGVSVALAGTIAFVGLVVPHMLRQVVGVNHKYLLPLSAFTGAILLIIADALARIILAPTELPVGLVTSFIGAPVFIYLLVRGARKRGQS